MKEFRVGIISLYHHNYNYGGLLQAYALQLILKKNGYNAKQISFDRSQSCSPIAEKVIRRSFIQSLEYVLLGCCRRAHKIIFSIFCASEISNTTNYINQRKELMEVFASSIDHTEVFGNNIKDTNNLFDAFICGSDQIWNPLYTRSAFFLDFVEKGKLKIAYAASIGQDKLSELQSTYIARKIDSFDAVSVREETARILLEKSSKQTAQVVLDPTLLLTTNEWTNSAREYSIDREYLFVYFLGNNKDIRKIAKHFAVQNKLTIVTIPHARGRYYSADFHFGDICIYDADPLQFTSLIRNAKYILTDSFHACVFSVLFKKQFVAFEPFYADKRKKMTSRIYDFLQLLSLDSQLISTDDYWQRKTIPFAEYSIENDQILDKARRESLDFLLHTLDKY